MPRPPPLRTLGILARKGGVGKTTLAVHLAVAAQQTGLKVLLVDCDPQRSAFGWGQTRVADTPMVAAGDTSQLRDAIADAAGQGFNLVVVDTRPSAERDTLEVASLADLALVPTQPATLDLRAIGATVQVLKQTKRPAAIVLNGCPAGRGGHDTPLTAEARRVLADYGLPVAPPTLARRAAFAHALNDGRAITELEPNGKAAAELLALWKWIEGKLWLRKRA